MAKSSKAATTTPSSQKNMLERHPLSIQFGLPTTDEERLALATDMERNGQHQEIILYEGKVLDGWERYMGCRQKGITPKTKEYTGDNPAAVAFGVNTIRRKLSGVQKAFFAAMYFLHCESNGKKISQADAAKLAATSLQPINEILQLMRSKHPEAKRCIDTLRTNPDVTRNALKTMMIDCGLASAIEAQPTPTPAKVKTPALGAIVGSGGPGDDEEDDDTDDENDLTGGALDDILAGRDTEAGDDDNDDDDDAPAPRTRPQVGDNVVQLPRGKIGHAARAHESPASACAKSFKGLTAPERQDFLKFAWFNLRPALEQALENKLLDWPLIAAKMDPASAAFGTLTAAVAPATKKSKAAAAKEAAAAAVAKAAAKPAKAASRKPARKPATARKAA